jgi:Putative Actinobacterial Holin-X, holin superfamily III
MMRSSDQSRDASGDRVPERSIATPLSTHGEPSATDAVERVLDAGQRLVAERIELVKLDVQEVVSGKLSQGAAIVLPGLFAFGGWWILMAALVAFLDTYLVLPASLAIVGGAHVLIGAGVAATALWRVHAHAAAKNGNGHPPGGRP